MTGSLADNIVRVLGDGEETLTDRFAGTFLEDFGLEMLLNGTGAVAQLINEFHAAQNVTWESAHAFYTAQVGDPSLDLNTAMLHYFEAL